MKANVKKLDTWLGNPTHSRTTLCQIDMSADPDGRAELGLEKDLKIKDMVA